MVIADVVRRTTGRGGEALGAAARAEAGAAARAGADDDGARAGADDAVRAPRT
jgi:hypothetical protein